MPGSPERPATAAAVSTTWVNGSDPGVDLLRQLADAARRGGLALACPDQLGRLIAGLGFPATERLVDRYLRDRRPLRWTADEGAQFIAWLAETEPALLGGSPAPTMAG